MCRFSCPVERNRVTAEAHRPHIALLDALDEGLRGSNFRKPDGISNRRADCGSSRMFFAVIDGAVLQSDSQREFEGSDRSSPGCPDQGMISPGRRRHRVRRPTPPRHRSHRQESFRSVAPCEPCHGLHCRQGSPTSTGTNKWVSGLDCRGIHKKPVHPAAQNRRRGSRHRSERNPSGKSGVSIGPCHRRHGACRQTWPPHHEVWCGPDRPKIAVPAPARIHNQGRR